MKAGLDGNSDVGGVEEVNWGTVEGLGNFTPLLALCYSSNRDGLWSVFFWSCHSICRNDRGKGRNIRDSLHR